MRQVTRYTEAFKESVLTKVLAPNGPNRIKLAKELNIPYDTLHTWIKMSTIKQLHASPQRPNDKSPLAKLQAVIDSDGKTDQELGAYCREHGVYPEHINEWKKQFLENFIPPIRKKDKIEHQQITSENKKLKSDLHRKDKALAEVSALLILKKKADLLWGVNEDV